MNQSTMAQNLAKDWLPPEDYEKVEAASKELTRIRKCDGNKEDIITAFWLLYTAPLSTEQEAKFTDEARELSQQARKGSHHSLGSPQFQLQMEDMQRAKASPDAKTIHVALLKHKLRNIPADMNCLEGANETLLKELQDQLKAEAKAPVLKTKSKPKRKRKE
jgi:hypothetical protein